MLLFIDGGYLYREFAYRARKQQEIIYETKQPIGCIQPINNYVLVFDTLVRMIVQWRELLKEIQKRYEFENIVFIKTPIGPMLHKTFLITKHKRLNTYEFKQAVQEIIDKFNFCGNRFPTRLQEIFENIANYFGTYTDGQWGAADQDYVNKLIKEILHIYSIDQTYLHQEEHEYIYNIFSLQFEHIASEAEFTDSLFLSNKKKKNVEVFDINFNVISYIRRDVEEYEFKELTVSEDRKIEALVKSVYPYVLFYCDDNFLPVIKNTKNTYYNFKRSELMDAVELPRSIKASDYTVFSGTFLAVSRELNLHLEKYI